MNLFILLVSVYVFYLRKDWDLLRMNLFKQEQTMSLL
jgi:hypothetical protein